jgi:CheY-like chemotaxis protein
MDEQLLANKRVLVVEDEMLVLMGIEDMLADLGCTSVARAANVSQALNLIEHQSFDLATLDLNLDGRPSYSVAHALVEHDVPFAFSTGYGQHGVGEGYAGRPVLNKPFSRGQFVETLKELLALGARHPAPAAT